MKKRKFWSTEQRYRQLAFQLFGEYSNAKHTTVGSNGPVVSLVKSVSEGSGLEAAKSVPKFIFKKWRSKKRPAKEDFWRDEESGSRCLICYVGVNDSMTQVGSSNSLIDAQSFSTFLQIIRPGPGRRYSNGNGVEKGSEATLISELEGCMLLCKYCCAITLQLISTHCSIKQLERNLLEMKIKILNVIKLSQRFARTCREIKKQMGSSKDVSCTSVSPSDSSPMCRGVDKLRDSIINDCYRPKVGQKAEKNDEIVLASESEHGVVKMEEVEDTTNEVEMTASPVLQEFDLPTEINSLDQAEDCENEFGPSLSDHYNDADQDDECGSMPGIENQSSPNHSENKDKLMDEPQKPTEIFKIEPTGSQESGLSRQQKYFQKLKLMYPGKSRREIMKIRRDLRLKDLLRKEFASTSDSLVCQSSSNLPDTEELKLIDKPHRSTEIPKIEINRWKKDGTSRQQNYLDKLKLMYPGKSRREIFKIRKELRLKVLQEDVQIVTDSISFDNQNQSFLNLSETNDQPIDEPQKFTELSDTETTKPKKLGTSRTANYWRKLKAVYPGRSIRGITNIRKELRLKGPGENTQIVTDSTSMDNQSSSSSLPETTDKQMNETIKPTELSQTEMLKASLKLKKRRSGKKPTNPLELHGKCQSSIRLQRYKLMYPGKSRRQIEKIRKELKLFRLGKSMQIVPNQDSMDPNEPQPQLRQNESEVKISPPENVRRNASTPGVYNGVEIKSVDDGRFYCGLCGEKNHKPVRNIRSVRQHINRWHQPDDTEGYKCAECGKKFYYFYPYSKHIRNQHLRERHQCHLCGATFANEAARFYHIRIVHEGIRPHTCEYCGKSFGTKKDMTIHVRRHTGEKPFVCHVCAAAFVDKQSMKTHIRRRHPDQAEGLSSSVQKNIIEERNQGQDGLDKN